MVKLAEADPQLGALNDTGQVECDIFGGMNGYNAEGNESTSKNPDPKTSEDGAVENTISDHEEQGSGEVDAVYAKPTIWAKLWANTVLILIVLGLMIISGFVGHFTRPVVLDEEFWQDFLKGPPAAGAFAVMAAFVAYFAARQGAKITKANAEETEWRNSAQWAIDLALSTDNRSAGIGLSAMSVLLDGADKRDDRLIRAVALAIRNETTNSPPSMGPNSPSEGTPSESASVDNIYSTEDNKSRRRWFKCLSQKK
ncbi:hypothetical protein [Glutamicibacter sp. NPDC087344]|uniref:hypothetical protein n=1 Tax=Glutamicibacter sp. NPDC087344 TaxID=3363994 RepID=UPI0037F58CCE